MRNGVVATCESIEARAWEDIFASAPPEIARGMGLAADRRATATALRAATIPEILFNRIFDIDLDGDGLSEASAMRIAFREAGINRMGMQIPEPRLTDAIASELERSGLARGTVWGKFVRGTSPPPDIATELRVVEIGAAEASSFGRTAAAGFGMPLAIAPWIASLVGRPRWHAYLALDGDAPVGTGALFVDGDAAWIGLGSTIPEARRRGAQGAVMARRISEAIRLGVRTIATETGEETPDKPNPSYRNMLRCGFRVAYRRINFIGRP